MMTVITKILSLTPLFFVVKDSVDYFYIPICYSVGSIGSGIICLYLMKKRFGVNFFFPKIKNIVIVTKDSANYFLSRISVSMFTNTNTFVLGLVLGNTIVGYDKGRVEFSGSVSAKWRPVDRFAASLVLREDMFGTLSCRQETK